MIPLETIAEHLIDHAALKVTIPQLDNRYVNVTGDTIIGALVVEADAATTIPLTVRGAAAQSVNLQEWRDSAAAVLALVDEAGHVAFGKSTVESGRALDAYIAVDSGTGVGGQTVCAATSAGADASAHVGYYGGIDIDGAGNQTGAFGSIPKNCGVYSRNRVRSASTVTGLKAFIAECQFRGAEATGSIVEYAGFYMGNATNSGGGAGSVTTQYGLYCEPLTFAATNYAIYTQGGLHRFGDDLIIVNGKNIILDTTTGTKIGTATTQKLGFFNAVPVTQRAKADYNNWAALADVVNALVALGLFDQV